jgi:hypothetical protein
LSGGAAILKSYRRNNPTPQTVVGYWWALKYHFFPNTKFKGPFSLSSKQFGPLMILFRKTFSPPEAFDLLRFVFENWGEIRQTPEQFTNHWPSTYPTPPFILHNAEALNELKQLRDAIGDVEADGTTNQAQCLSQLTNEIGPCKSSMSC